MIPRFGFIEARKWVWEVVKISTGPWVQYADHEQALAEKDREWKRRIGLDCGGHSCFYAIEKNGMRHNGRCSCDPRRTKQDYDVLYAKYQQLMEKAVRFAECLNDECKCTISEVNADPACAYVRAREFLESPEAQAWKEQS